MLQVVSNDQIMQQEKDELRKSVDEKQQSTVLRGLAGYLKAAWDVSYSAKQPIRDIMLANLRQRNGEYEPELLQALSEHPGCDIFVRLTDVKCRAAESWLRDILLDSGDPPWGIEPTPIPDLSPEQMSQVHEILAERLQDMMNVTGQAPTRADIQELRNLAEEEYKFRLLEFAHNRNKKMEDKISDQFAQGGWESAFNDFITDLVTYPAAIIKGPVVRRQRKLGFVTNAEGKVETQTTEELAPEFERVDPFKFYPEPGITKIEDGYLFEHHKLSRMELSDLIGVPGYDEDAVRALLAEGPMSTWLADSHRTEQEDGERKFYSYARITDMYDALEFWGKIPGKFLIEWELPGVDDPAKEYDANIWLCGNYVIKAVLNYDPLGEKPYSKTSFIKRPGSFWGNGIPEVIADDQQVCNAAVRSLINNMGIASGPQVEVNISRLPANEPLEEIYPWKIWQTINDPSGEGGNSPAVRFEQPDDRSQQLLAVFERFSMLADDHSGIPAYVHGDTDVHGAGRTASGLSMLMGSASKGIRQVVMHIDQDVTKSVVRRQYLYNMRYDEDDSIKGDAQVVAKGAVNLAVKETITTRRLEFLQATANEIDGPIVGTQGRAAILREVAKSLQMPVDDIVPSRDKMKFSEKLQALQGGQSGAPNMPGQGGSPPALGGQALLPDGSPAGGSEGNIVSNKQTGTA